MQNAHERFETVEFTKRTKDTTTRVRVYIDRAVLEPTKEENGQARAHLISMIGGDRRSAPCGRQSPRQRCWTFAFRAGRRLLPLLVLRHSVFAGVWRFRAGNAQAGTW